MSDYNKPQGGATDAAGGGQQNQAGSFAGWQQTYSYGAQPQAEGPAPGSYGQAGPGWPGGGTPFAPPPPHYWPHPHPWPHPGFAPMGPPPPYGAHGYPGGQSNGAGGQQAPGGDVHGMHNFINELKNGDGGLSSLTKLFDINDADFLKGAAVGALAVLVLTNDDIKKSLLGMFGGADNNGEDDE